MSVLEAVMALSQKGDDLIQNLSSFHYFLNKNSINKPHFNTPRKQKSKLGNRQDEKLRGKREEQALSFLPGSGEMFRDTFIPCLNSWNSTSTTCWRRQIFICSRLSFMHNAIFWTKTLIDSVHSCHSKYLEPVPKTTFLNSSVLMTQTTNTYVSTSSVIFLIYNIVSVRRIKTSLKGTAKNKWENMRTGCEWRPRDSSWQTPSI